MRYNKNSARIYEAFEKAGFTDKECMYAVRQEMDLNDDRTQTILEARRDNIDFWTKDLIRSGYEPGMAARHAKTQAARDLKQKKAIYKGRGTNYLFLEVSP